MGLARVPVAQWGNWRSYRWWDGGKWQSRPSAVAPINIDPAHFQVAMEVMPGDSKSLMIASQQLAARGRFGGTIDLYELANPANPQPELIVDEVAIPGCNISCYHVFPHPEYGTDANAVFSYFNTEDVLPVGQDWQFPTYGHTHSFDIDLPTPASRARPATQTTTQTTAPKTALAGIAGGAPAGL